MAKYIIDVPDEQQHIYNEKDKVLSFLVTEKNSKCNIAIDIDAMPYTEPDLNITKDNPVHLCNSCNRMDSLVPCPTTDEDVLFGKDGKSVCCCKLYKPYTIDRKAIEDAQEEAWKMASKCLWDITNSQSRDIFETDCVYVPRDLSYQEAKIKYEAWKKQKDEIRLGDEVEYPPNKAKGIVIQCHVPDVYAEVDKYAVFTGTSVEHLPIEWLTKTGRVFPEVAELMKKMKEEEE